jgi:hypothetical protein
MRRPYAGAYLVTLCAQGRVGVFGEVVDGAVRPNVAADVRWPSDAANPAVAEAA